MTPFASPPKAVEVPATLLQAKIMASKLNELVTTFRFAAVLDPRTETAFMVARGRNTQRHALLCPVHATADLVAWLPAVLTGAECSAPVSAAN
jgi:hypothetical protein